MSEVQTLGDLLAAVRAELEIPDSKVGNDVRLQQRIAAAISTFEDGTFRSLRVPATGDPDVSFVRECNGGVVRVPDARAITLVETSDRFNGPWTETTLYNPVEWFVDDVYVWLKLDPCVAAASYVRVTGKFGLFGLSPLPTSVFDAIVTLAVHRWRARGGEAAGEWDGPDGGPSQSFARLPPSYLSTVKALKVPAAPISWIGV